MSIQLAIWLYENFNLVSIVENGRFKDFDKEKDHSTAATVKRSAC
ncbi:hypothetical protein HNQ80_004356 [Anaerosolibacter carboniphilus]|uniref:Uncharacterized protein n=1 Tax=Anaerosolibacter carboniphilus TaxID=1417629 RepID=A0A841KWZ6_9FIRM|nr:hypothetical protein [Anaerosolibacter carboniphilus]MBB6218216.1 hypothetical protein [Anaerosolibacter carboniphilus]